ncbi:hypothetical protein ABZ698_09440 [Streptomyces antibioticus]
MRAAALDVLRALRLGDTALFAGPLDDPDVTVRIEAVRALVSADTVEPLAGATDDASRGGPGERGQGPGRGRPGGARAGRPGAALGHPGPARRGPGRAGPRRRPRRGPAAADRPAPLARRAVAALSDPARQIRVGAAIALPVADPDTAVPVLAKALADMNADVRRAAVLALTRHRATGDARAAPATAKTDSDADVRVYASRAP